MMRSQRFSPYVPQMLNSQEASPRRWEADGTLVFCDISGFTRMSERLAAVGRGGAEEVTNAIDRCFSALIDEVFSNGGDVLSFGGDALLCWFTGERHARAGLAATVEMQRWIRQSGRESTSKGPIRLRMSIGMASGMATFELAGRQSSELLVLGTTVDRALDTESDARPGEIRLDQSTVVQVPSESVRVVDGATLADLRRHTSRSVSAVDPGQVHRDAPADRFVLPSLRARLSETEHHSEHRPASIAFVRAPQGDGSRTATETYELIEQIVERHDVHVLGTDVDRGGFKVVLAAGVPDAVSRRRERLTAAALETATTLRCPTGVADGMVFAGDVGHANRRTWTVMGDTVNTAARLAGSAEPGDALVHGPVARELDDRFDFAAPVQLALKGKAGVVEARPVVRASGGRLRPTTQLPLQGRDDDLRSILDAQRPVELVAPHGFGRTRLLAELAARSAEHLWCVGTPSSFHRGWSTLTPLLRWLVDRTDGVASPDRDLARAILGSGTLDEQLDMPSITPRLILALASAFQQADERPLILIDDIQWADVLSAGVIVGLAENGVDIVTTRTEDDRSLFSDANTVTLDVLSDDAVERIAVASARQPLSDHDLGEIVSLSGGVPQHTIALAMYRGDELPQSIEELRSTAFDKLSSRDRFRLRVAAVAGFHIDAPLLAAVTGDDAWLDPNTPRTLDAFLTESSDGWHFRHETDRQVAYLGMPVRTRQRLHCDIARHLASMPDDAAVVVTHAMEGGDHDLCASMGPRAAAQAARRGAWHDAHRFAVATAAAQDDPDEELTAWVLAADAAEHSGQPVLAEDALRHAIRLSGDPAKRALLWSRRSRVARRAGRLSLSLRWCTMGLAALDDADVGPTEGRSPGSIGIELQLERAATLIFQERIAPARACVEVAYTQLAEHPSEGDRAQVLILEEMLLSATGDAAGAQRAAEEALPILLERGELLDAATVLVNRGAERGEAGDWITAVDYLSRARTLFERIGHVVGEMISTSNLSGLILDQGHVSEAAEAFDRIARIAAAANRPDLSAFAESSLGRVESWRGNAENAETRLLAALRRPVSGGDHSLRVWMQLFYAEAAALRGDHDALSDRLDGIDEGDLEHLPAAQLAFRRLGAVLLHDPTDSLRSVLRTARDIGVHIEVVQSIRSLIELGAASSAERAEADRSIDQLQIKVPPPLPVHLLRLQREEVR